MGGVVSAGRAAGGGGDESSLAPRTDDHTSQAASGGNPPHIEHVNPPTAASAPNDGPAQLLSTQTKPEDTPIAKPVLRPHTSLKSLHNGVASQAAHTIGRSLSADGADKTLLLTSAVNGVSAQRSPHTLAPIRPPLTPAMRKLNEYSATYMPVKYRYLGNATFASDSDGLTYELRRRGYEQGSTPKDGSCLFHALLEAYKKCTKEELFPAKTLTTADQTRIRDIGTRRGQSPDGGLAYLLRMKLLDYIVDNRPDFIDGMNLNPGLSMQNDSNRDADFTEWVQKMRQPTYYGDVSMIVAFTSMYFMRVVVLRVMHGVTDMVVTPENDTTPVVGTLRIGNYGNNHFMSLTKLSRPPPDWVPISE